MWTINKFYIMISFISLTYSSISYYWAKILENGQCSVITNNSVIDSFFWLGDFINNLILWQYPMIYIFWPTIRKEKLIHHEKSFEFTASETNNSITRSIEGGRVSPISTRNFLLSEMHREKMLQESRVRLTFQNDNLGNSIECNSVLGEINDNGLELDCLTNFKSEII